MGEQQARLVEAAQSNDPALLEEVVQATDAAKLKRGIDALVLGAPDSDALKEANTRLAELVGGSEDVAYRLQTPKYSLDSTHGEKNESSDRTAKQSPTAHAFTRAIHKHEGAFEDGFRRDGIGVREEASAIRPDVGSFGDTKNCYAYVNESADGANFAPAMVLASYVPMMIAADAAKGIIQGGGDTPGWKKGWGVSDYVGYGVERAGLLGVGQFAADIVQDVNRGGSGFGALSGPTLEQLAGAVQLMGGNKQFGPMLLDAMPANALYKESVGGSPDVVVDAPGVRE